MQILVLHDTREHSVQGILPTVGDHAWANGSTPISQKPKHGSKDADENHHAETLVRVRNAKRRGRNENRGGSALRERQELPLQVAAKDRLFADACGDGERDPTGNFYTSMREHGLQVGSVSGDTQEPANDPKHRNRHDPESKPNADVS